MDWNSLLALAVFGLTFYFMVRHGGCCGGHSSHTNHRKDPPRR